jgi:cysteine-rich repeat protein
VLLKGVLLSPRSFTAALFVVFLTATVVATPAVAQTSFVAFESGHVRPITLSPNGSKLFAVNTPDNTLEIFDVGAGGLTFAASVPVGMEPVSVAARTDGEVWVVNHLSDSISIVDVSLAVPMVTRTLLVGDEPRDIVFAGTGGNRAFITTAHRGQHRTHSSIAGVFGAGNPADPQFATPGIDRADVWVFDATNLGTTIGGTPDDVLTFFSDTPRALATDGTTVYVAAFMSGNQTTVVNEVLVNDGFGPSGAPGPNDNANGDPAPEVGVIVKLTGGNWLDANGTNRNAAIPFDLPDNDVFAFNANTLTKGTVFSSVGTTLFNMAINPTSGKIYVTNTESPNEVMFEGHGDHGGSTVQGKLSLSRVTILDPAGAGQQVQHLNQHINYANLHTAVGANHTAINAQIPHSLATPLQPTISSDGDTIYIPAFGSKRIGVFTRTELEDTNFATNFDPTIQSANYLSTFSGGPTGLALDEVNNRLYVMMRFNNLIEVVDLATKTISGVHLLHNPEPASIIQGRPVLYDAINTSGNGEASCSSCHIFGDLDGLAWNLGDPDELTSTNNQPQPDPLLQLAEPTEDFHPMKGPMTTQTLKGMSTHGAMHWRGDRADGFFGTDLCTQPGYGQLNSTNAPCDEANAFKNFIVAFEGLLGKEGTISTFNMALFTNFMLQVQLPPNPVSNFDNSLTAAQQAGSDKWFSCGAGTTECAPLDANATDTVEDCDGCHSLDPLNGFFGTGGEESFEGEPQHMKVPHLRNVYTKVGMFSAPGPQVRGTGLLHDGSVANTDDFLGATVFGLTTQERQDLEQFVLAFPTDLAPIVGQQVTIGPANFSNVDVNNRIVLINSRGTVAFESSVLGGAVKECDVIMKTVEGGVEKGYARLANGFYVPDTNDPNVTEISIRAKANPLGAGLTITYTAVPPGSGVRMGIDRDEDDLRNGVETNTGIFIGVNDTGTNPAKADTDGDSFDDGVEVTAGTDPTNASSFPGGSVCGDLVIEAPEECDDGNTTSGDGCSNVCVVELCSDGIVQAGIGEQCDDGNLTNNDGCSSSCQNEICGDSVQQTSEQCDDGNIVSDDGCSNVCVTEFCSDTIVQAGIGEQCDDGNLTNSDGCSSTCQDEICGDSIQQTSEECDDGNIVTGDGCSNVCVTEFCSDTIVQVGIGEQCDDGNLVNSDGCSATCLLEFCGDTVIQSGEQCDDGNAIAGDGCSATCQDEVCGNSFVDPTEECDDGNLVSGDGCSAVCINEICSDNIVQAGIGEECDDGNLVDGDGCTSACILEICSDLVVQAGLGEECDDGNLTNNDGCSSICLNEICSDNVVQTSEQCDDGNLVNEDGCSAICLDEFCGDSVLQAGLLEECDDGNVTNGDGCSNICAIEGPVPVPSFSGYTLAVLVMMMMGVGAGFVLQLRRRSV